ncbi:hypothetical protein C9374_010777 [Naegleria lovaniensis]|uniref:F-box domain-containing protein n=1 Tax=Naegleria lovaniensis TaxID=51637 RepID=A0AA88KDW5_NAELO|nr:uncharacterized protein C9374_010777 [Naegleria lovaniensis]KAG2374493.1 hypothetical protein C9374_010777 [Naegleria lovaniensis]
MEEKRIQFIRIAMKNLKDDGNRICPFCLQPMTANFVEEKMNHDDDIINTRLYNYAEQLSEHVSICLNLWNNEKRILFGAPENSNINLTDSNQCIESNRWLMGRDSEFGKNLESTCHTVSSNEQALAQFSCSNEHSNKRKLESFNEAHKASLNKIPTKKKKQFSNLQENENLIDENDAYEQSFTRLDDVGDDMMLHILKFLDQKFLIHTCMTVSKYWYEIVSQIPFSLVIPDLSHDTLSILRIITSNPNTFNFTALDISGTHEKVNSIEMIKFITTSNQFSNLTWLNVRNSNLATESVKAIANSIILQRLRKLDLGICNIGKTRVQILSQSPYLKNITKIDLWNNNIQDEGVAVICESEFSRNITSLILSENGITEKGTSFLTSNHSKLFNLSKLDLTDNLITSKGAILIATSNVMQNLQKLYLQRCDIGDEGLIAICESNFLKKLTRLCVNNNSISYKSMPSLISSPICNRLQQLMLSNSNLGYEGARLLCTGSFPELKALHLKCCNIGNDGLLFIAACRTLSLNLTELDLDDNNILQRGLELFATVHIEKFGSAVFGLQ